jgi:hypothetical protein
LKRSNLVLALFLLALWAVPGRAQEPSVKTADVYPRGARVAMEAPARPDMTFDLPLSFEEESIRVSGEGTRILSVETSRVQRTGWIPPALAGLDARMRKSRSEVDRLEARGASLQQTVKHLQDTVPSSWKPQDLLGFLDVAAKRREQVEQEMRLNARALEKAKAELARIERELSGKMPPEPDAATRVRVKTAGAGTVRLLSWTPQASWNTRYVLDLAGKTGRVAFSQEALVQQKTGLDWDGEIVLHTVQPRRTMTAPELRPLVVDFERTTGRNADTMMAKQALAPEEAGKAVQEETLTDLSLKTRGRASGDGTPGAAIGCRLQSPLRNQRRRHSGTGPRGLADRRGQVTRSRPFFRGRPTSPWTVPRREGPPSGQGDAVTASSWPSARCLWSRQRWRKRCPARERPGDGASSKSPSSSR